MAYIELSKRAYFHNLTHLCERVGEKDKLAVVLKDNAYGHGLVEIATLAKEFGITKAVVRNFAEAQMIVQMFPFVLVLAPDLKRYQEGFSVVINRLEDLDSLPSKTRVHLKIDTGMHRNGIMIEELEKVAIMIAKKSLILEGVMTHFRAADELSCELFWQKSLWADVKKQMLKICNKQGWQRPLFHSENSAALLRSKIHEDDFARCGIATYGYDTFYKADAALLPVLTLWAEKISSRALNKGARVGYGGAGMLREDRVVSTYDVGYADGYFRLDGKDEQKTVEGYSILGRVSMDSLSVVSECEKVALFQDASALAGYHDSIVYEVLVRLSPTLSREVSD